MTGWGEYGPGREGFELVAELWLRDDYNWELVDVHRELSTGKLWAMHDGGCSCYGPHQETTWPSDYTEVRQLNDAMSLVPHVEPHEEPGLGKRTDFARKVGAAIRANNEGSRP